MLVVALLLSLFLWTSYMSFRSWKTRERHLGIPFTIILVGISVLNMGFIFELVSNSFDSMLIWNSVEYIGISLLMLGLGLLFFNYLGWVDQWDDRSLIILSIVPALVLIMVVTDGYTSLYYARIGVDGFMGMSYLETQRGIGYWLMVSYILLLLMGMLVLILRSLMGAIHTDLAHMTTLTIAVLSSIVFSLLPNPFAQFPSTLILIVGLSILIYPVYKVTFREGVLTWALSYRAVLDLSTDIKLILDRDRILYANQTAKDALGDPPVIPEQVRKHMDDHNSPSTGEELSIGVGDETRFYELEMTPLTSRVGMYQATMVSMKDITEEVRTREALRLANEKLKLLSSISRHDMINQLTVVTGMAYLLKDILVDDRSQRVLSSINRAADSIHRQLMFMKDYDNIGASVPEWVSLPAVVDDVMEQMDLEGIEAHNDVGDYVVLADPMFDKVLTNLLHNSLLHGDGVTTIRLCTEEVPEGLHIHYRDDGGGVPAEFRAGLFEKGVGVNSGLGLFLSRSILQVTGMDIIELGDSQGVDFIITVPSVYYRYG